MIHVIPFVSTASLVTRNLAENETDGVSLRAFKSMIIQDPQGVFNSWNESRHFCEWEGITCGRRHRRVTALDLNSRGLYGSLSPYIGNLSFLRKLILQNNSIQGEIPHEFGNLFRLKNLSLANNSLVGEIPTNLSHCSRLKVLSLQHNQLVGIIPLVFNSLYNLIGLSVFNNNLKGGIPPFLGNLTSLTGLFLANNPLGGHIPDSLGQLRELTVLALDNNNLFGIVPPSLYNLSFLISFTLPDNQLHGTLPPDIGLTLPNLQFFEVSGNFFSGSIPVSLSNVSGLNSIEMDFNQFSGKFSVDFGGMQFLEFLSLGENNLGSGEVDEMKFIDSLVNCSNLLILSIERNQFRGALPHSIANLSTSLQIFYFGENQLHGRIPPGITNLINLVDLKMQINQLTGPIPTEIGKLYNLVRLSLHDNQLSGGIPSSLRNLFSMSELYLNGNKFLGVIPSYLGNLKQLSRLYLSKNEFSGTISEQIFDITHLSITLNLAQNHLVGSIPPNIGNLKDLSTFIVSKNHLSGKIPNELGLCSNLEYLHMEGNIFHGSIPPTLSLLKGIREIDLSRNNLSGQIPKFLESLHLEKLNLSYNDLEGEVPRKGIFANASAISLVGNSNRLCGGIAELRLPKCPNNNSKKDKSSMVFKILISIASILVGVTVLSFSFFLWSCCCNQSALKSFMAECKALRNIRHRNLVKVLTSCSSIHFQENDFKAIIYEFMANGSLEKWLHQASERVSIAIDVASALNYLHHHCPEPVLHCDLKPSNIILDNDMTAHVGDFGLVRFLPEVSNPNQSSSVGVKGTIGYAAPEYGLGSEVSTKGDAYSYGILLLEMATRKKPTDIMFEGDLNLHNYARLALPDRVMDIVDPILVNEEVVAATNDRMRPVLYNCRKECLIAMVRIGVACSSESPQNRMDITQVVHELQSVRNILLQPTNMQRGE
ncbi:hypothetical protein ACOSQ4_032489 [Xanthoceras sorbifolium]